jgi:hypothetical protein
VTGLRGGRCVAMPGRNVAFRAAGERKGDGTGNNQPQSEAAGTLF